MSTILSIKHPVAKKVHSCDACTWLNEGGLPDGMKYSEVKKYIIARREGFKIKVGTKYVKIAQIYNGDFCTFRARPEIDELCHKYDVYQDD